MAVTVNFSLGKPIPVPYKDIPNGATITRAVGNSQGIFPYGYFGFNLSDPDTAGNYYAGLTQHPNTFPGRVSGSPGGGPGGGGIFDVSPGTTATAEVTFWRWTDQADRDTYLSTGTFTGTYTQIYYGRLNITNLDPVGTTYQFYPPDTGGPINPSTGTPTGDTAGDGGSTDIGTPVVTTTANANIVLTVPEVISSLANTLPIYIEQMTFLSGDVNSVFSSLGEVTDCNVSVEAEAAQLTISTTLPQMIALNSEIKKTKSQLDAIVAAGNSATEEEKLLIASQLSSIETLASNANVTIPATIANIWATVNSAATTMGTIGSVISSATTPDTVKVLKDKTNDANVTPLMEEISTFMLTGALMSSSDTKGTLAKEAKEKAKSVKDKAKDQKKLVNDTIDTMKRSVQSTINDIKGNLQIT